MKFVLWLLLAALVLGWLMRPKKRVMPPPAAGGMPAWPRPAVKDPEPMLRCQACGTYIPASEASISAQASYCSEEHRRQHQAGR